MLVSRLLYVIILIFFYFNYFLPVDLIVFRVSEGSELWTAIERARRRWDQIVIESVVVVADCRVHC